MNIVITGTSSGLGKLLADKFRSQKHNVIGLSRTKTHEDDISCDISSLEAIENAFLVIKQKYSHIDLLINNAGYGVSGATELIPYESAKHIFDVNFFGTLNCTKFGLPLMQKHSRIVNISSVSAMFALPYRALYSASKSAVSLLSYSMRMELAPAGIDVVCICPGDTKTPFTKNREKHFETNERYENRIANATNKVDGRNDKRMSAERVASKIYKIISKKKSKPMYIIGAKYKLLHFASKVFPLSLLLKATIRAYGGKK